ncbi:DUF2304 family protein [Patescibacteria group bacterium]|nr:DUF2304 family protein [Patescibacteria group bacterium]MBU1895450.1 DUF2304 family protein [Patescibacteria group bacterium]
MIIIFQILFLLFALFAITSVLKRRQTGVLGPKATLFWVLFWLSAVLVVMWPASTSKIAGYLGIGRGTDLVIYASVAVIFYLLFKLNIKLDSLNREVTKVVRREALNSTEEERKIL